MLEHQQAAFETLVALSQIIAVVAAINFDMRAHHLPDAISIFVGPKGALFNFPNFIYYSIQKQTVMADQNQCAVPIDQHLLQPFDGFDVQMIGRLVHDQHIWVF